MLHLIPPPTSAELALCSFKVQVELFFHKMHELSAFRKAFLNTQREMILSLCVLSVTTFVLSREFYLMEHIVQPGT